MQYTKSNSGPFLLTHSPHSVRWGIIQTYVLVQGIRRRVRKGEQRGEGRRGDQRKRKYKRRERRKEIRKRTEKKGERKDDEGSRGGGGLQ